MKTIKKFGLSILVNLLALLSAVVNIWQFCRAVILTLVDSEFIQKTVTGLKYALIIIMPIYYLFFDNHLDTGWKWFVSIGVVLLLILLSKIINMISELIGAGIGCLAAVLNAEIILEWLLDTTHRLITKYLYYSPNGINLCERIISFPLFEAIYYINKLLNKLIKIISIAFYPSLAALFGHFMWIECFTNEPVYDFSSAEFYFNSLLVLVAIGASIFIAYHIAKAIRIAVEKNSSFEEMLSINHFMISKFGGQSIIVPCNANSANHVNNIEGEE